MSPTMAHEADTAEVIGAARREARRMLAAIATTDGELTVTMKVAQFRTLAHLIDSVATAARGRWEEPFDAPIDGVRFWVPLAQLEAERERFADTMALAPVTAMMDRSTF